MSERAYTDDDVTAGAAAMEAAFTNRRYRGDAWHDGAEAVLDVVTPAIAARALREAARLLREAAESFPLDESGLTLAAELLDRERARAEQVNP